MAFTTRVLLTCALAAVPQISVAQTVAGGSSLASLITELEQSNAELQAAKLAVDMRIARIAPAGALADPIVSASSMTGFTRPPFLPSSSTPDAFRQVGLSQEIPFPGKRALRTSIATIEVDAERWNYEDRRKALVADLKATYLEYALSIRMLAIVAENKTLLDQLREIAETRFSVGKGLQQDVIKAQLEISMLIERQTILEQQRQVSVARLNALLFRPSEAPGPPLVAYVTEPVPRDIAALQALVEAQYPALQRDSRLIDKSQQSLALAKRDLRPDFQFGVSAQRFVGDMPWMYGVDIMVSVPLYASRKQRPLITEAAAALVASGRSRESRRAVAASEVTQAFLAIASADQLVALYSDSVLPQSRLALESSLAAYQVGSVDFLSVLTNFEAVLTAQVARLEQQTRRDQALVRLEPYVGLEFVR